MVGFRNTRRASLTKRPMAFASCSPRASPPTTCHWRSSSTTRWPSPRCGLKSKWKCSAFLASGDALAHLESKSPLSHSPPDHVETANTNGRTRSTRPPPGFRKLMFAMDSLTSLPQKLSLSLQEGPCLARSRGPRAPTGRLPPALPAHICERSFESRPLVRSVPAAVSQQGPWQSHKLLGPSLR